MHNKWDDRNTIAAGYGGIRQDHTRIQQQDTAAGYSGRISAAPHHSCSERGGLGGRAGEMASRDEMAITARAGDCRSV